MELVHQEFGVKVSYYKLRTFYLKNGVRFRNTQMVYRNHLVQRHGLEKQRTDFIKEILNFIMLYQPYVYFDEMAVHSFMYKDKAWSFAETPITVPVNSGGRLKCSVYGAIGNIFDGPLLMYRTEPTNGIDFLTYLKMLK